MEKEGIIEKIETAEGAAPIVVVPKKTLTFICVVTIR